MSSAIPIAHAPGRLSVRQESRVEDGQVLHALLWHAGPGWRMISSAVLGGGIGERAWVLNAQVAHGYRRVDPGDHLVEVARGFGAQGNGVGLMTAANVQAYALAGDNGVETLVTAGISVRGWAAAQVEAVPVLQAPGTINIMVRVPAALTDAALVNAVATATEAKVQALLDAGYDCSGTPTDAVCVAARSPQSGDELHAFAGPRSVWGGRLARSVYGAVREALPAA
ncbi:adenosylcobinamide amidohydrolase [Streptomyces sp. NPDC006733]|uniref:adenosylcobinamide amidohydrolase n=1 Tax=Streptomyces sp. NPDC006733 TaxID=3155460 RepID=UPI0033D3740E